MEMPGHKVCFGADKQRLVDCDFNIIILEQNRRLNMSRKTGALLQVGFEDMFYFFDG